MNRLRRVRRDSDTGFTLVELMVALAVLAVAFSALLATIVSGYLATQRADARVRANQLAAKQIEGLQSVQWTNLGLFQDEATAAGVWNGGFDARTGESIVVVAAATPSPRPADVPQPTSTTTDHGVEYTVSTMVTWTGSSSASPNDGTIFSSKRLSVLVSWTFRGQSQTLRLEDYRTPTPLEMAVPPASLAAAIGLSNASANPGQTLTASGNLTSDVTVLVDSATMATTVNATMTLADGTPLIQALTPDATYQHWSGKFPAGAGPFVPGTATVTFNATGSGGGTGTASATVSLVPAAATVFQLASPTAVTTSTTLNTDNTLATPLTVSVAATTPASAVTVQWKLPDGSVSGTYNLTYDSLSSRWTYTVPVNGGPFVPGNVVFTFSGTPVAAGTPATATTSVSLSAPSLGDPIVANVNVSPALCVDKTTALALRTSTFTVEVKNISGTDPVKVSFGSLGTFTATPVLTSKGAYTMGPNGGFLFSTSLNTGTNVPPPSLTYFATAVRAVDGVTSAPYSKTVPVTSSPNKGQCP